MYRLKRSEAFEILGISEDSDQATIRKAWRALVRRYHPDLAKEDRDAANKFLVEINEAFDLLSAGQLEQAQKTSTEAERRARAARRRRAQLWKEAVRQAEMRRMEKMTADAERQARRERDLEETISASSTPIFERVPEVEDHSAATLARRRKIFAAVKAFGSALFMMSPGKSEPQHDFHA